jgi:hypothetical protein
MGGEAMTNEEYARKVAEEMGWEKEWFSLFPGDKPLPGFETTGFWILDGLRVAKEVEFDPATDWASAGAWIEWLISHNIGVKIYQDNQCNAIRCILDLAAMGSDVGWTPLLALKAASEKYFEAKEGK